MSYTTYANRDKRRTVVKLLARAKAEFFFSKREVTFSETYYLSKANAKRLMDFYSGERLPVLGWEMLLDADNDIWISEAGRDADDRFQDVLKRNAPRGGVWEVSKHD